MAYQFDGRIRFSEVGQDRKQTIVSLVDYFQDASIFQSEDRGVGLEFMDAHHCLWVLVFWQIDITRRAKLGERVVSQTRPYAFKAFYGYRNFALLNERGAYLAKANSVWTLMDLQTGRPIRVLPELIEAYGMDPKLEMEYLPRKIRVSEKGKRMETISVAKHHLDTNHHVNNGQYIAIAQEFLPEEFETKRLCVEYRKQAHLHDRMTPYVCREEDSVTVSLCDEKEEPFAIVKYER